MIHQKRHNKSSWTQSSPTRRLCVTSTSVMIRAAWAGCGLVLAAGPSLAQSDALALSSPLAPQPVLLGWKPASTPLHSRWMETQVRTLKIPWQSSTRTENQAFVETWRRFQLFLQSSSVFCVPASSNQTGMKSSFSENSSCSSWFSDLVECRRQLRLVGWSWCLLHCGCSASPANWSPCGKISADDWGSNYICISVT